MMLQIFKYSFSAFEQNFCEHLKGSIHPEPRDCPEARLMSLSEPLEDLLAGEEETATVRVPRVLPVPHHQGVALIVQTEPETVWF